MVKKSPSRKTEWKLSWVKKSDLKRNPADCKIPTMFYTVETTAREEFDKATRWGYAALLEKIEYGSILVYTAIPVSVNDRWKLFIHARKIAKSKKNVAAAEIRLKTSQDALDILLNRSAQEILATPDSEY
jgi:hypothetical protein